MEIEPHIRKEIAGMNFEWSPLEDAKERYPKISQMFHDDKLYFLLGLKPVLRIEGDAKGLESLPKVGTKEYTFIGRDKRMAQLAAWITEQDFEHMTERENALCNYLLGLLYGYPKSCSLAFPQNNKPEEKEKRIKETEFTHNGKKFHFSFYPCSRCMETPRLQEEFKKRYAHLMS
jgi:hypothetical protein